MFITVHKTTNQVTVFLARVVQPPSALPKSDPVSMSVIYIYIYIWLCILYGSVKFYNWCILIVMFIYFYCYFMYSDCYVMYSDCYVMYSDCYVMYSDCYVMYSHCYVYAVIFFFWKFQRPANEGRFVADFEWEVNHVKCVTLLASWLENLLCYFRFISGGEGVGGEWGGWLHHNNPPRHWVCRLSAWGWAFAVIALTEEERRSVEY